MFAARNATPPAPDARRPGLAERLAGIDVEALPWLGKLPPERRQPRLAQVLVVALLLASLAIGYYLFQVGKPARNAELAANMQLHAQRAISAAERAARGEFAALSQLKEAMQAFDASYDALAASNPGGDIRAELDALGKDWEANARQAGNLPGQHDALASLGKAAARYASQHAELLQLLGGITTRLGGESAATRMGVYQLAFLGQRLAANVRDALAAPALDPGLGASIDGDIESFKRVADGLLAGDAELGIGQARDAGIRERLFRLRNVFAEAEADARQVGRGTQVLRQIKLAAAAFVKGGDGVMSGTRRLADAYAPQGSRLALYAAIVFALVALASLILLGLINVAESRRRAEESQRHAEGMAQETRRNQDAILRLLNEMGELAEGNLTIRASVTEDITGAIADAVNFAIEELRALVENVNRASAQVTDATVVAREIASEMLASSDRQSQEVAQTTESINHMSQSIAQVSRHAGESSGVAQRSLASARQGGEAVRNVIAGMGGIREQIQETSKRIKRLGESSQEIGEILDLITDITEQTNVLALNAAIQAAAAGEAGRGFTVVAEEVQRLAERSGQATRRIGAIVKTIQSDTQDAVHAMALTTQGVVKGTDLSDAAGVALRDIETVSEELARLMRNISGATTDQARTAAQIASTMQRLLAETRQTEDSAQKSAQSIADLTALSDELKVSVAGFKL
jgi:twitching motility protein PilJ